MAKLRHYLRKWLGIATLDKLVDSELIETGRRLDELEARPVPYDYSASIQALQEQITSLQSIDSPLVKAKPPDPEQSTILSGHVRFSDRKRAYEASKRLPLTTETGKQIEENHRLIASGTRKTE
jgi:hypothetical protein